MPTHQSLRVLDLLNLPQLPWWACIAQNWNHLVDTSVMGQFMPITLLLAHLEWLTLFKTKGGGRLCPSQYTASPPRFKMLSKPQLTLIQAKGGRLCPSHYYENWFFHFEVFIRHTSLNVYLGKKQFSCQICNPASNHKNFYQEI